MHDVDARAASAAPLRAPWSVRRHGSRSLIRVWLVPVVVGVLAAVATAFAASGKPPVYRDGVTLLIDQPKAIAGSVDSGVLDKLGRLRYKYAGLVRTDVVVSPVARQLDLPEGAVRGGLAAQVDPASLLMTVSGSADAPGRSRELASAGADAVIAYAEREQRAAGIAPAQQFTFSVVVPAGTPTKISAQTRRVVGESLIAGILAAAVGSGVVLLTRRA